MPLKLLTVIGARPQFVKAALLSEAFAADPSIEEITLHTGQHFDDNMSGVFFRELGLPAPSIMLDIHGGHHGAMTGHMLEAIERTLLESRPHAVLVYGDTNSTLAGALAAAKLQIPVIHVEAGLRSFNRAMPEEINRVMTDHLSSLLLCPTSASLDNLAAEGIRRGVHHVGDIMYDVTLRMLPVAQRSSSILERLGLEPKRYEIATVHRAENTSDPVALARVVGYLKARASECALVLPLHPRTRNCLKEWDLDLDTPGLITTEPLGFLDMCLLTHEAALVHTDSGGLQKEAYFHGIPCVTLRSESEWVETIDCGWNRLWSVPEFAPRKPIYEYGNGDAVARMLTLIRQLDREASR